MANVALVLLKCKDGIAYDLPWAVVRDVPSSASFEEFNALRAQGIKLGLWGEPFFNVPKELGPYAYSTINIRQESIKKEPEVVRGFVRGMIKGLKYLYAGKNGAASDATILAMLREGIGAANLPEAKKAGDCAAALAGATD